MRTAGKPKADPVEVRRLYVEQGLSLRQVAEAVGVSFQRVQQILDELSVGRRPAYVPRFAANYTGRRSRKRKAVANG